MTRARPSYADIYSGLTTITLEGAFRYELECDWEVNAESLDYKLRSLRAFEPDGECFLHLSPAHINDPIYFTPERLVRFYDKQIRSALWAEIGPSIPSIEENHLVN